MSKEVDCSVIRDLLPLYEDGAASEETAQLVREHLEHCPDCREELRKMRTPISLPPDGEGELLRRYNEQREAVRRKKRNTVICAASILAAVLLLCLSFWLWFTRPQSWAQVAGEDRVDGLSAFLSTDIYNLEAQSLEERFGWDIWRLSEQDVDSAATDAFLDLLDRYTYRSSLSNLRNFTPFPRNGHKVIGSAGYLSLYLYLQDHQECISLFLYSNGDMTVYHTGGPSTGSFLYRTDPTLYEEMAALIRAYGTQEE